MAQRRAETVRFEPVKTLQPFEDAVNQIADRIRVGDLRLGDALPSERALAAQMGISRRTLREAVRVLVQAGVLEVKPGAGGGTYVTADVVPTGVVARGAEIRLSEISHVLEARRLIEPQVAQLAAVFADPDDFLAMEKTIELQKEFADEPARQLTVDTRFHLLIARAAGNAVLVDVMKDLLAKIEIARDSSLRGPGDTQLAIQLHERTLAALRSRDVDVVAAMMDEHLAFLEQHWVARGGRLRLLQLDEALHPRTFMRGHRLRSRRRRRPADSLVDTATET